MILKFMTTAMSIPPPLLMYTLQLCTIFDTIAHLLLLVEALLPFLPSYPRFLHILSSHRTLAESLLGPGTTQVNKFAFNMLIHIGVLDGTVLYSFIALHQIMLLVLYKG